MKDNYLSAAGAASAEKPSMADRLISLATQALPIYERQKILDAQLRAQRRGLAPLDMSNLAPPPMTVQVTASPEDKRAAFGTGAAILGIIGVGALVMLTRRPRRRR